LPEVARRRPTKQEEGRRERGQVAEPELELERGQKLQREQRRMQELWLERERVQWQEAETWLEQEQRCEPEWRVHWKGQEQRREPEQLRGPTPGRAERPRCSVDCLAHAQPKRRTAPWPATLRNEPASTCANSRFVPRCLSM
jgi:hypothetical protein